MSWDRDKTDSDDTDLDGAGGAQIDLKEAPDDGLGPIMDVIDFHVRHRNPVSWEPPNDSTIPPRYFACLTYSRCLDYVCSTSWASFSCQECPLAPDGIEPETLPDDFVEDLYDDLKLGD